MASILSLAQAVDRVLQFVVSVILFLMMALIVADAAGRMLNWPMPGVAEITEECLMPSIVFLSLAFTHTAGRHIRVELFGNIWPLVGHRYMRLAINLIGAIYFALIAWFGGQQAAYAWATGQRSASELAYPMAPAHTVLVAGATLMTLWLVLDAVLIASGRKPREKSEVDAHD